MRADTASDWPLRLRYALAKAPVVDTMPGRARTATQPRLTPAELRTLEYASHGLTTPMTADVCDLSRETVKGYLAAARYKLRAKNTTHAVAEALRRGLIS